MAVKSRTKQQPKSAPLEQVRSLVRHDLGYDGETWHTPRSIGRIMCLHGTRVDSIERLAIEGRFSGETVDLEGQFYTVPNPRFRQWERFALRSGIGEESIDPDYDAFGSAIDYAETSDAQVLQKNAQSGGDTHGVVVAFKGAMPADGKVELYEDPIAQNYELIFPHAPRIEAIEGIYPIDQDAANFLAHALERIGR
jgi:hypothetical protein